LDAGDQSQGTPWYNYYKGAAAAHFLRELNYDAFAIGNHEFDKGVQSGIEKFREIFEFFSTILCSCEHPSG